MREEIKDKGRLEHILEAIRKVEDYTQGVTQELIVDEPMRKHATAYNIQIQC